MQRKTKITKLKGLSILFIISMWLMPYDSIPGILPSVYRPISIYSISLFFLLIVLIELRNGIIIDQSKKSFLFFTFYSVFITILISAFRFNLFDNSKDYFITFAFGIMTFYSFNNYLKIIKKGYSNEKYIEWFFRLISNIYIIPLSIGFIELLCLLHILPIKLKIIINNLLGGFQYSRITMGSKEASWISMQLIIILPILLFLYIKFKKKRYILSFILSLVIFVYNVSMQGFMTLLFSFIIYTFIISIINNKFRVFIKNFLLSIVIISLLYIALRLVINILPSSYYTDRLAYITDIPKLIRNDGSAFIRIVYPITSGLIFIDNPLIGIGGGNYPIVFGDYIMKFFPWAIPKYPEVAYHIATKNTGTGCLYMKVLAEFGVVGGLLFSSLIFSIMKKIKYIRTKKLVVFWCISIFSIMIQFDSYAYVPFWVCMAFINNFDK